MNLIRQALEAAKANGLTKPKIRLPDFSFSLAPDSGRNPGFIYIYDMDGKYSGKVDKNDNLYLYDKLNTQEYKDEIKTAMESPLDAAVSYGRKTGNCSCCGRLLTNALSVQLGIGPICRENFGWGELNNPELELELTLEDLTNIPTPPEPISNEIRYANALYTRMVYDRCPECTAKLSYMEGHKPNCSAAAIEAEVLKRNGY